MTRVAGVTGEIVRVAGESRSRPRQTIPRPIGNDAHAVQIVLLVGFALWVAVGGLTLPLLSSSLFLIFLLLLLLAAVCCIPGKVIQKNFRKCRLFSSQFKKMVAGLPQYGDIFKQIKLFEIQNKLSGISLTLQLFSKLTLPPPPKRTHKDFKMSLDACYRSVYL